MPRREFDPGGGGAAPWVFLAPLIAFAAVFFVIPLGFSIWLSFTRWNPLGTPSWVGLRQFEYLFTRDGDFWRSILNTFVFAFGFVALGVPLSLGLAFVFSRARGKTLWRSVYYLPQLTNIVAIAYLWQFVLDDRYGAINRLLGMVGLAGPNWLSDPAMAMVSVVLVMIWYDAGKNMLVFSAALEGVDREIYDAAALDGASPLRTLTSVTLPIIRPAFIFVTITSFITGMGFFALILAMTGGGPRGATEVTALYTYQMAFESLRMGRASAGALILFAIIGVLSILQFRALRGRE
ncbi:sugar ABC transporter permease [Palleronia sediminis]|uniref:Sugar ABC transporter permease n=1 Tax=Palleronia sediminis TaxID=2547833 RepID=A0A4R6AJA8_9RHOB|nr:sugar ABC transporter permease [Palleronia sediminis]TDL81493.1 sugar ABC transporter permease [Palleronia sediminis]